MCALAFRDDPTSFGFSQCWPLTNLFILRGSGDDMASRFASFEANTAQWQPTVAFQAEGDGVFTGGKRSRSAVQRSGDGRTLRRARTRLDRKMIAVPMPKTA